MRVGTVGTRLCGGRWWIRSDVSGRQQFGGDVEFSLYLHCSLTQLLICALELSQIHQALAELAVDR